MNQILDVKNLSISIESRGKRYPALHDINFTLHRGEIVGLVGESGCGKSLTSLALMGLLPAVAHISGGEINFNGRNLAALPEKEMCPVRGQNISMIFQEPMTALNPLLPVGVQVAENFMQHHGRGKKAAEAAALQMMEQVGLPRVRSLYWDYPHQLSGGMKQRIVIAMALVNHPELLIADEPTTALDVTIQYQILTLLRQLSGSFSTAVLLVSHDLGVVREVCSRILVMYEGYLVEEGAVEEVLARPLHPYTRQLLASIPTPEKRGKALYSIPGMVSALHQRQSGICPFCGRCSQEKEECKAGLPALRTAEGRGVRCFFAPEEQNETAAG
ncbi:MAG: ABC transporter ATP-binding protein [Oscillospiraceae bacterium]